MTKYMREKLAVRVQPTRDTLEENFVIAKMFKHLDRDNPVIGAVIGEVRDVRGDLADIVEAPSPTTRFDEMPLSDRVG